MFPSINNVSLQCIKNKSGNKIMKPQKKNYYAVAKGRKIGIYKTWAGKDGAQQQISGFSGALYKGFYSYDDAQEYLNSTKIERLSKQNKIESSLQLSSSNLQNGIGESKDRICMYTDGGCSGNPGPGGYGIVLLYNKHRKELSGGFRLTTNNRMEIMACIFGLQTLKRENPVTIYSDSKYVVDSMTLGWVKKWKANHWKRNKKERAENSDLWEKLLHLCEKNDVNFIWVKGHSGNPENERCDQLAVQAISQSNPLVDEEYEREHPN